jgi:uncharacterized Zn finger protein
MRTRRACEGCGAILENETDLTKEAGTARRAWRCADCGTSVPGIVAEKINHQKQNGG